MLVTTGDKKHATEEPKTLQQYFEQVNGILSDLQNAAIKTHLIALSVGNNPHDKKQLDIIAGQFCSLASQAATAISNMNHILERINTLPTDEKRKEK